MALQPRDLEDGNCNDCDFWRSRVNCKKGVLIPGGYGKCIRPQGHCLPHTVRGGMRVDPARQVKDIVQQLQQENEMAKRDNPLFKKTTVEPEVVDQAPAGLESYNGRVIDDDYSGLDAAPPQYYEVKPLSANEQKRRTELEGFITRNFKAFYEVGCALREIQQHQLYRTTHGTFADYCKDLWEMARSTAYQFIDAAEVVEIVRNCAQSDVRNCGQIEWVPANESQARALLKYKEDPEAIRTIVAEAVQTAPDGKITASHLKKTARRLHLEKVRNTITKTKRRTNQAPKISEDFRRAFNDFLDQINIERASEYKHTDRNEVIRHVRVILEALEAEL